MCSAKSFCFLSELGDEGISESERRDSVRGNEKQSLRLVGEVRVG